jgi:nucleotide-binding universal stress UspA family protein
MTIIATLAKFSAAWLTQKTFGFSVDERRLIFGLSNAQAAATLAAVLVGYNIVLGQAEDGKPIRLLSENVLNGTILMILVTCTIASFIAQKGAQNIAIAENADIDAGEQETEERILIPVNNIETTDELINLSITIKSKKNKTGLYAMNVISNSNADADADKKARKILHKAAVTAAATDNRLQELLRYDLNIVNAIASVVKEHKITDLVLGLHEKKGITDSFLGNLTEGILTKADTTTLIYKPTQPLATISRHLIVLPEKAEREIGFPFWLVKVWNMGRNTGARLVFYASVQTLQYIQNIHAKHPIDAAFVEFSDWTDFLILARDVKKDDNLIIVLSRKDRPSYNSQMTKIPAYLNKYFQDNNFILIYPVQSAVSGDTNLDLKNPSLLEPFTDNIDKLDDIGKTIANLFGRK